MTNGMQHGGWKSGILAVLVTGIIMTGVVSLIIVTATYFLGA